VEVLFSAFPIFLLSEATDGESRQAPQAKPLGVGLLASNFLIA
jgi:hypothetical protein